MLNDLDNEQAIVDEVGSYLSMKDFNHRQKKERLHKKWNENIYTPIKGRIGKALKNTPAGSFSATTYTCTPNSSCTTWHIIIILKTSFFVLLSVSAVIQERNNRAANEYIRAMSAKGGAVFRDIIIGLPFYLILFFSFNIGAHTLHLTCSESDYDPLRRHTETLKYSNKGLRDPIKRDLINQANERELMDHM
jgi:hypothetical protein